MNEKNPEQEKVEQTEAEKQEDLAINDTTRRRKPWWPFWAVLLLYIPIRSAFVSEGMPPLVHVIALFDPFTLVVAIALGLFARSLVPQQTRR